MAYEDYYKIASVSNGLTTFAKTWKAVVSGMKKDGQNVYGVDGRDDRIYPPDSDCETERDNLIEIIERAVEGEEDEDFIAIEFSSIQSAMLYGFVHYSPNSNDELRDEFRRRSDPWFQMNKGWSRCIYEILPSLDKKDFAMLIDDMKQRVSQLEKDVGKFRYLGKKKAE